MKVALFILVLCALALKANAAWEKTPNSICCDQDVRKCFPSWNANCRTPSMFTFTLVDNDEPVVKLPGHYYGPNYNGVCCDAKGVDCTLESDTPGCLGKFKYVHWRPSYVCRGDGACEPGKLDDSQSCVCNVKFPADNYEEVQRTEAKQRDLPQFCKGRNVECPADPNPHIDDATLRRAMADKPQEKPQFFARHNVRCPADHDQPQEQPPVCDKWLDEERINKLPFSTCRQSVDDCDPIIAVCTPGATICKSPEEEKLPIQYDCDVGEYCVDSTVNDKKVEEAKPNSRKGCPALIYFGDAMAAVLSFWVEVLTQILRPMAAVIGFIVNYVMSRIDIFIMMLFYFVKRMYFDGPAEDCKLAEEECDGAIWAVHESAFHDADVSVDSPSCGDDALKKEEKH